MLKTETHKPNTRDKSLERVKRKSMNQVRVHECASESAACLRALIGDQSYLHPPSPQSLLCPSCFPTALPSQFITVWTTVSRLLHFFSTCFPPLLCEHIMLESAFSSLTYKNIKSMSPSSPCSHPNLFFQCRLFLHVILYFPA